MISLSTTPGITSTRFAIQPGPSISRKQCWIMRSSSIWYSSLSQDWKSKASSGVGGRYHYTSGCARLPYPDASSVCVYLCGKRPDASRAVTQVGVQGLVGLLMGPRLQEVFNQPLPRQFTGTLQFLNFLFQFWAYANLDNLTFGHRTSPITSMVLRERIQTYTHADKARRTDASALRCLLCCDRESACVRARLHRTQRTLLGICPCRGCIVVVSAINHDISRFAMEQRETGIDPDTIKSHTTAKKRLS